MFLFQPCFERRNLQRMSISSSLSRIGDFRKGFLLTKKSSQEKVACQESQLDRIYDRWQNRFRRRLNQRHRRGSHLRTRRALLAASFENGPPHLRSQTWERCSTSARRRLRAGSLSGSGFEMFRKRSMKRSVSSRWSSSQRRQLEARLLEQ